jgi:hypothetical protein
MVTWEFFSCGAGRREIINSSSMSPFCLIEIVRNEVGVLSRDRS